MQLLNCVKYCLSAKIFIFSVELFLLLLALDEYKNENDLTHLHDLHYMHQCLLQCASFCSAF